MFDTVNKVYFEIYNYVNSEELPGNSKDRPGNMAREYMYDDIHEFIEILLKNKYTIVVKELDKNLVVIEYNFNNDYIKTDATNPEWLTPEEHKYVTNHRKRREEFLRKLP